MAKDKDSIILYESFFEATEDLSALEKAELWDCFGKYLKGISHTFESKEAARSWKFIKLQLDADKKKYEDVCKKRSLTGKAGGIKSGESRREANEANASESKQTKQKQASEADTDTDTDINKKKIKKEKALEIYAAYPRKVAKPAALKAITNAFASVPSDELLAKTQAYAEAVAKWSDKDREFIPHPATWFNQERYNDDPSTWERTQTGGKGKPTVEALVLVYQYMTNQTDGYGKSQKERDIFDSRTVEEFEKLVGDAEMTRILTALGEPFSGASKHVKKFMKG